MRSDQTMWTTAATKTLQLWPNHFCKQTEDYKFCQEHCHCLVCNCLLPSLSFESQRRTSNVTSLLYLTMFTKICCVQIVACRHCLLPFVANRFFCEASLQGKSRLCLARHGSINAVNAYCLAMHIEAYGTSCKTIQMNHRLALPATS